MNRKNFLLVILVLFCGSNLTAKLVLSEFMPYPEGEEPEWIELLNDSNIDYVGQISISDLSTTKIIENLFLKPNQYCVLSKDTILLKSLRIIPIEANLIQINLPSLNNTVDAVVLKYGNSIDSCYYDMKNGKPGKSFERVNNNINFIGDNLAISSDNIGATAGRINSQSIKTYDLGLKNFNIEKDSISFTINNLGINKLTDYKIECFVKSRLEIEFASKFKEYLYQNEMSETKTLKFSIEELAVFVNDFGLYDLKFIAKSDKDQNLVNDTLLAEYYFDYPYESVTINEIMYQVPDYEAEYFELANNTGKDINLYKWKFFDKSGSALKGFVEIDENFILKANDLAVIAFDSSIINKYPNLSISKVLIPNKSISLNDTGDKISFAQYSNSIVDSVEYSPTWHDETLSQTNSISLEKINRKLNSNSKSSWTSSADKTGGTPTLPNSVFNDYKETYSISSSPNPFNPNGSEKEKFCILNYHFNFVKSRIQALIFDLNGNKVRTLANDQYSGPNGFFVWDGKNEEGFILPIGQYVLMLEAISLEDDNVQQYKSVLVIGN